MLKKIRNAQKAVFTTKELPCLQQTLCMEKKMGKKLGECKVLQRKV